MATEAKDKDLIVNAMQAYKASIKSSMQRQKIAGVRKIQEDEIKRIDEFLSRQ